METQMDRQCPIHSSNGPADCEFCNSIAVMLNADYSIASQLDSDDYDAEWRAQQINKSEAKQLQKYEDSLWGRP